MTEGEGLSVTGGGLRMTARGFLRKHYLFFTWLLDSKISNGPFGLSGEMKGPIDLIKEGQDIPPAIYPVA